MNLKPPIYLVRLLDSCDGKYPHNLLLLENSIERCKGSPYVQAMEFPKAGKMQCLFIASHPWGRALCKSPAALLDNSLTFIR